MRKFHVHEGAFFKRAPLEAAEDELRFPELAVFKNAVGKFLFARRLFGHAFVFVNFPRKFHTFIIADFPGESNLSVKP